MPSLWAAGWWQRVSGVAALAGAVMILAALVADVARADVAASNLPLPTETLAAMKHKSVRPSAPIYLRIFKEESELEVWKARADGRYVPLKTFPVCNWSGGLGPKEKLGDRMAPEGFYSLTADALKPDSKYHLALNVGYPNALDRALGRTGDFIMVHGQCVSVGCFAMTNDLIEEIYALVREALEGGQTRVPVHVFPFRMTTANVARHKTHAAAATWAPLKDAYDDFAETHEPPRIAMCGKRYVVNPIAEIGTTPAAQCPTRIGKLLAPLSPNRAKRLAALAKPLLADGPKTRTPDAIAAFTPADASAAAAEVAVRGADKAKRRAAEHQRLTEMGGVTPLLAP